MTFIVRMTTPEGDTHYASTVSHRGKRCCSATIAGAEVFAGREAAEKAIAEIRGVPHVRPYFFELLPYVPTPVPAPAAY
jgi:hypothetical protein